MPSENDDSDDGRKGLGDVVPSTRRAPCRSRRSSDGREGVPDPSAVDDEAEDDGEEAQTECDAVDVDEGSGGGESGVAEEDDEEEGRASVDVPEEEDVEEEKERATAAH
jgi:hypothetical protein